MEVVKLNVIISLKSWAKYKIIVPFLKTDTWLKVFGDKIPIKQSVSPPWSVSGWLDNCVNIVRIANFKWQPWNIDVGPE